MEDAGDGAIFLRSLEPIAAGISELTIYREVGRGC